MSRLRFSLATIRRIWWVCFAEPEGARVPGAMVLVNAPIAHEGRHEREYALLGACEHFSSGQSLTEPEALRSLLE